MEWIYLPDVDTLHSLLIIYMFLKPERCHGWLELVWSKTAELLKHAAARRLKHHSQMAHGLCAVRHNATVQSSLSFQTETQAQQWKHMHRNTNKHTEEWNIVTYLMFLDLHSP